MNLFSRSLRLLFDYPLLERLSSSMAEDQEPNLNDDGTKSYFQKTVVLSDWWLIKCPNEFEGKRFGVAGTEDLGETRARRVFKSSPIIKALDYFTLIASDGINIILQGFLNNQRVVQNGFTPEISREFIFGFPPGWERICNNCFSGESSGTDVNAIPSSIDKACSPILSPCKNLKDNPAESRDKSNATETNIAAINDKDGCSSASGKETIWRKSLHLQSNSARESAEDDRKLESSKVQNTTNDGDHGSEGLDKAESNDVEKDGCVAIDNDKDESRDKSSVTETNIAAINDKDGCSRASDKETTRRKSLRLRSKSTRKSAEDERKLESSNVHNTINDGDHGSEGLDKAKSNDVEKDGCVAIDNEVISPLEGCDKGPVATDSTERLTTKKSLRSEQRKGRVKVTKTFPDPLPKGVNSSRKPGKEGKSKKSEKTRKSNSNVVELINDSGPEIEEAEGNLSWEKTKRKIDFDVEVTPVKEVKKQKSNAVVTTVKEVKKRKSNAVVTPVKELKKQKSDAVVTPVKEGKKQKNNAVVTPVKELKKQKSDAVVTPIKEVKKQNNVMVTPVKEVKKQNSNAGATVSADSLGQKRSRSGRALVSPLEFWRNQIPVYDLDRNLVQVKEGCETNYSTPPSKGEGSRSASRKPRR